MSSAQFQPSFQFYPSGSNIATPNPKMSAYNDTTPTQTVSGFLTIPANNTAVGLPIPSYWTYVTTVGIINCDPTTILWVSMKSALTTTNPPIVALDVAPSAADGTVQAGGSIWVHGQSIGVGLASYNQCTNWLVQTAGNSSPAAMAYVFLAGH